VHHPSIVASLSASDPTDHHPDFPAAAHEAAGGQVVYITEHGRRPAAIVPADLAEDIADAAVARAARASVKQGEALVPWEQIKAEAGK
jgi:antitoxin Phd